MGLRNWSHQKSEEYVTVIVLGRYLLFLTCCQIAGASGTPSKCIDAGSCNSQAHALCVKRVLPHWQATSLHEVDAREESLNSFCKTRVVLP